MDRPSKVTASSPVLAWSGDPEMLREHPYDVEKTLRLFEEANR